MFQPAQWLLPGGPPQLTLLFSGRQRFLVGFLGLQTLRRGLPVAKIYKRSAQARFCESSTAFYFAVKRGLRLSGTRAVWAWTHAISGPLRIVTPHELRSEAEPSACSTR